MKRPLQALGFTALAGAILLSGCNRNQAGTADAAPGAPSTTTVAGSNWPTPTGATTTTVRTTTTTVGAPAASLVPAVSAPMPASDPCPSIGTLAESHGGRIALSAGKVVRLAGACNASEMTNHLRSYGSGMRYLLVADDLRAGVQPGALFRLSLGPPTTGEAAVIGTLSFYGAQRPGAGGMPHSMSFDVTREVQALAVAGWPNGGLGVAVSPSGEVAPGADASIGAIRLVAQGGR